MGMADILVKWPVPVDQTFVPPFHGDSIWDLTLSLIGQVKFCTKGPFVSVLSIVYTMPDDKSHTRMTRIEQRWFRTTRFIYAFDEVRLRQREEISLTGLNNVSVMTVRWRASVLSLGYLYSWVKTKCANNGRTVRWQYNTVARIAWPTRQIKGLINYNIILASFQPGAPTVWLLWTTTAKLMYVRFISIFLPVRV